MSSNAYQKKLREDLEALDLYIVTDMSGDQFISEEADSSFTHEELTTVLACAETGDFTEFYRQSPEYVELPSGAGFVWKP